MKIKNQYYRFDKLRTYEYYRDITSKYFIWQMNENNSVWAFLDNLLTAQLIHARQVKTALDLGTYLGMLPLFTEDILKSGQSDNQLQTRWTLVDNFSFLIELNNSINDPDRKTFEPAVISQIQPWKDLNLEWTKDLPSTLRPPTNPTDLSKFHNLIISHYNSPKPNISSILTDVNQVVDNFDLIHFDLAASRYYANRKILESVVSKNLNKSGIVIFDDVKTATPAQLALFIYSIKHLNLYPIAFSQSKVACVKAESLAEKESLLINIKSRLILAQDRVDDAYDWAEESTPEFGNYLKLRILK